mgnify:CR=1 FL=1
MQRQRSLKILCCVRMKQSLRNFTGERFHSFLDPALSMRCVAPERIAADVAGATNVRSTPLSLTIDASDFSLAITSPLLPLTSNSTIECQLHSTHPLTHIALEDFVVKNGFLVSLDPEVHTAYNHTTGIETYYYDFTIKATVQGQVCVDILKSRDYFWNVRNRHIY